MASIYDKLKMICPNVYKQKPPKEGLKYPCIMLDLDSVEEEYASNKRYNLNVKYKVTLLVENKGVERDSLINALLGIKYSKLNVIFTTNNINNVVFSIYERRQNV